MVRYNTSSYREYTALKSYNIYENVPRKKERSGDIFGSFPWKHTPRRGCNKKTDSGLLTAGVCIDKKACIPGGDGPVCGVSPWANADMDSPQLTNAVGNVNSTFNENPSAPEKPDSQDSCTHGRDVPAPSGGSTGSSPRPGYNNLPRGMMERIKTSESVRCKGKLDNHNGDRQLPGKWNELASNYHSQVDYEGEDCNCNFKNCNCITKTALSNLQLGHVSCAGQKRHSAGGRKGPRSDQSWGAMEAGNLAQGPALNCSCNDTTVNLNYRPLIVPQSNCERLQLLDNSLSITGDSRVVTKGVLKDYSEGCCVQTDDDKRALNPTDNDIKDNTSERLNADPSQESAMFKQAIISENTMDMNRNKIHMKPMYKSDIAPEKLASNYRVHLSTSFVDTGSNKQSIKSACENKQRAVMLNNNIASITENCCNVSNKDNAKSRTQLSPASDSGRESLSSDFSEKSSSKSKRRNCRRSDDFKLNVNLNSCKIEAGRESVNDSVVGDNQGDKPWYDSDMDNTLETTLCAETEPVYENITPIKLITGDSVMKSFAFYKSPEHVYATIVDIRNTPPVVRPPKPPPLRTAKWYGKNYEHGVKDDLLDDSFHSYSFDDVINSYHNLTSFIVDDDSFGSKVSVDKENGGGKPTVIGRRYDRKVRPKSCIESVPDVVCLGDNREKSNSSLSLINNRPSSSAAKKNPAVICKHNKLVVPLRTKEATTRNLKTSRPLSCYAGTMSDKSTSNVNTSFNSQINIDNGTKSNNFTKTGGNCEKVRLQKCISESLLPVSKQSEASQTLTTKRNTSSALGSARFYSNKDISKSRSVIWKNSLKCTNEVFF